MKLHQHVIIAVSTRSQANGGLCLARLNERTLRLKKKVQPVSFNFKRSWFELHPSTRSALIRD